MIPNIHPLTGYCKRHSPWREFGVSYANQPVKRALRATCNVGRYSMDFVCCHVFSVNACPPKQLSWSVIPVNESLKYSHIVSCLAFAYGWHECPIYT